MGIDYENPTSQVGFRVLFFENVIKDEAELLESCPEDKIEYTPLGNGASYAVEFHPEKQYITENDHRFYDLTLYKDNEKLAENYADAVAKHGHRIDGYPYFTQEDPRSGKEELQDYELLFQLDTE